MTVQYAIVAFPNMEGADHVEALRQRFDPLAGVIGAHVTLVFPFADAPSIPSLEAHVAQAVSGVPPFDILLATPTLGDAGYLVLNVIIGASHFVELHDRLYTGALARHLLPAHIYRPHVTIGRVAPTDQLAAADEALTALPKPVRGRVDHLAVFRLDQPARGAVQLTVSL